MATLIEVNINLDGMMKKPVQRLMPLAKKRGTRNNPIFSTLNDKRGGGVNRKCRDFHYSEVFAKVEEEELPSLRPPDMRVVIHSQATCTFTLPPSRTRERTSATASSSASMRNAGCSPPT